jgi:APA family basic amino acid/polyamine antiporter
MLVCVAMMASLGIGNWVRLIVWLALGLAIYFGYSRHHSRLVTDPESNHR